MQAALLLSAFALGALLFNLPFLFIAIWGG